jgi:hypothetical protein
MSATNMNGFTNDGRTPTKRNGAHEGNKASQGDINQGGKGSQNQTGDYPTSSKKRTLTDMLNNQGPDGQRGNGNLDIQMQNFSIGSGDNTEGAQIEQLLHGLKKRVLQGETLHNFKKEIAQISLLIDKSEN